MVTRILLVAVAVWTLCGISGRSASPVSVIVDHRFAIMDDVVAHQNNEAELTETESGQGRLKRATPDHQEKDSEEAAADDTDMYLNGEEDTTQMAQHFFPSFFPSSFGSPRPHIYPNSSPRTTLQRANSNTNNNFQPIGFLHRAEADSSQGNGNVLGSGNFGVIRGGTFYNDADRDRGQASEYENYQVHSPYYHNGHGRPSFYKGGGGGGGGGGVANPRPQQQRGNDFFANFRDFADINAPTKSSYSELYVVYVNKNASRHDQEQPRVLVRGEKPKNIIEQLALIDETDEHEIYEPKKKSALSPTKLKLERTFKEKRNKAKKYTSPKELYEPLLALS